ncbi:MAG: hypothetical protein ABIO70_05835 [Pseudomonadota bacterium]
MHPSLCALALVTGCADPADTGTLDSVGAVPRGTRPCEHPEYWPYTLPGEDGRFTVHYRQAVEAGVAEEVAAILAHSLAVEIDDLGFRPPLPDAGRCGPDDGLDVFLWHGLETCYADVFAENPDTWHDDWFSYIVVDPWGPYGGDMLDSTLAHELNHACQAADDWWDSPIVFEMTSCFIEEAVYDDDDTYMTYFADFQAHPDWSLDYDDGYRTWYMYGATMFFYFLRDRYFDGDFSWASRLWLGLRSAPGAQDDPSLNEPDFEDSLEDLLQEQAGIGFLDAVVEFARWRVFTGARDDGRHFEEGGRWPEDASLVMDTLIVGEEAAPRPMVLGNVYYRIEGEPGGHVALRLEVQDDVTVVLQAIPGLDGSDGELLGHGPGRYALALGGDGTRTLALTVLPTWEHDPDTRADTRYPLRVVVEVGPDPAPPTTPPGSW